MSGWFSGIGGDDAKDKKKKAGDSDEKEKEFKLWKRHSSAEEGGGYGFRGDPALDRQRNIVMEFLKQIGSNMMSGKWDLIGVTMPVFICQPRSYLICLTDGWVYAPRYLNAAAATKDAAERMRLVFTFVLSGLHNTCCLGKPFNPILGETYEAHFESDGTRVYCEQSSHHPPITNWQIFGPKNAYHVYGFGEWSASFGGNSIYGNQHGKHYCAFADGGKIEYGLPTALVKGILWGDRIIDYEGDVWMTDEANKLAIRCKLADPKYSAGLMGWFGASRSIPSDYFRATLYRYGDSVDDVVEVLSQAEGTWLGGMQWGDKTYWSLQEHPIEKIVPSVPCLPSDSRFREDACALAEKKEDEAAAHKHRLEEKQRRDKRLRIAAAKRREEAAGGGSSGSEDLADSAASDDGDDDE